MAGGEVVETIRTVIDWAGLGIEVVAAAVIVIAVAVTFVSRGIALCHSMGGKADAYKNYKRQLGRPLLLGLDLLVAGDVVKTIAVEPTLANVAALGLLVVVRAMLSWSISLEVNGRWPWQAAASKGNRSTETVGLRDEAYQ